MLLTAVVALLAAVAAVLVAVIGNSTGDRERGNARSAKAQKHGPGTANPPEQEGASKLKKAVVRNIKVPVLMYHVIADPPAGIPLPGLYVSPDAFKWQMLNLSKDGFTAVTLDRAYEAWHGGRKLPEKPVVVSFDDGYHSQYKNAFPVLKGLHWPGVLSLKVNSLKSSGGLTLKEVRALIRAGWEIDAHSITHADLSTASAASLQREVAGARSILRRRFEVPVNFFCYPSGRYNDATIAAVQAAGYRGATSTKYGLASPHDQFTLNRIRVSRGEGASAPLNKIRALYQGASQ